MANEIQVAKKVTQYMQNPNIQERLKAMLDKNAETFVTSVLNVVNASGQLQKCDPMSIVKSAMVSASLKLPIDPNLGFSAIVPYGKEAQFQIMYKGLVQLAIRSGQYETINVTEVYADEIELYNPFTGDVTFTKSTEWKQRYENDGEIVGYYAYFRLLTGFNKAMYMTQSEVEKHAYTYSQSYKSDKDKGWNSSRWSKDFNSMAKKTVLKMLLSKFGILSVEMQQAVTFDQSSIGGTPDNPQPKYIDNPDYEEPIGKADNPFKSDNVDNVMYEIIDDDIPDILKG